MYFLSIQVITPEYIHTQCVKKGVIFNCFHYHYSFKGALTKTFVMLSGFWPLRECGGGVGGGGAVD